MTRKSRRRRRQRKRKAKRNNAGTGLARRGPATRIKLAVEQLELARGHDGLLRGMPEPTMILGIFGLLGTQVRLLGRYLYQFDRPDGFPTKVAPQEASQESVVASLEPGARLALMALAVERDSGRGLQRLFAQLEHGDTVMAWSDAGPVPMPTPLPELCVADRMTPDRGHRIHLMFGDRDPSQELSGDDWIDANLLWTAQRRQRHRHRLHFVSADGRNDWTAELLLTLQGA